MIISLHCIDVVLLLLMGFTQNGGIICCDAGMQTDHIATGQNTLPTKVPLKDMCASSTVGLRLLVQHGVFMLKGGGV